MPEERLDRIENKVDHLVESNSGFQGEVRQFMKNQETYVESVNTKINDHLKDHNESGFKGWSLVLAVIAAVGGLGAAVAEIIKK